jgi:hypothetical protein
MVEKQLKLLQNPQNRTRSECFYKHPNQMLQMKTKTGRAASCSAIFRNGSAHILFILAKSALETFMSLNAASNFLFLSKNSGPGIG